MVQETSVSRTSSGLETSFSVLELQSRDHFPRSGPAVVTCEAAIPYSSERAASSVTYWSTLSSSTSVDTPADAVASGSSHHQFQRRIASDSHGERVFRSRNVASSETLQALTLRTEIRIFGKRIIPACSIKKDFSKSIKISSTLEHNSVMLGHTC